jgi:hypothetical protein
VPLFTSIGLEGDRRTSLARLPAKAGVAQVLGPDGRNLLIGRPANLRKWASNNLGLGRPVAKGKRPPVDLSPIATAVVFAEATSPFHQRLLFERLMERHVPREKRRDLKPPAFLRLDPAERFPRLTVLGPGADLSHAFGPFHDRRSAERAREALQKLVRLRPCDYEFEPHPQLPLGLGCLFAQVRSCAAPCLVRVNEDDYRGLALQTALLLAGRGPRPDELAGVLPSFVAEAGSRGVVAASNRSGVELYPVLGGMVCEEDRIDVTRRAPESGADTLPTIEELEAALAKLHFERKTSTAVPMAAQTPAHSTVASAAEAAGARDDRPWLLSWLKAPRRAGDYLVLSPDEPRRALAARVREVLT